MKKAILHTGEYMGIPIVATNLESAVYTVCNHLHERKGEYITFVNVHVLVTAVENPEYRKAQELSAYSFADGVPIVNLQKKKGYIEAERVAGPDFMDAILKAKPEKKYRHYFYGGSPDNMKQLLKEVSNKYPDAEIVGSGCPEFIQNVDEDTFEELFANDIEKIKKASPDFIWVGLGTPKQEWWMMHAHNQYEIDGIMVGVGAAFDFISGTKKRAPIIIQRLGLEWLHRMLQEPRRLFHRYFYTNIKFLQLCFKERLKRN